MPWAVGHSFLGNAKTCRDEDGLSTQIRWVIERHRPSEVKWTNEMHVSARMIIFIFRSIIIIIFIIYIMPIAHLPAVSLSCLVSSFPMISSWLEGLLFVMWDYIYRLYFPLSSGDLIPFYQNRLQPRLYSSRQAAGSAHVQGTFYK